MMMVPVEIRKSPVHGHGVFAATDLAKGTVLWQFMPGLDQTFSDYVVKFSEPRLRDFIRERGYINPKKPLVWVLPGDEAQFWNFAPKNTEHNCEMGGILDGEQLILAARDIAAGEELFVPPESDADYARKLSSR